MSANTGYSESFGGASKIARLAAQAMEYIALGNRDTDQVERLEKALQLFKENSLGDVLGFRIAEAEGKGKSLGAQFAARRRAFKRDLELVGEWEVQQAFYDSFSGQAKGQLRNLDLLLRDLVLWSERRLMERMGKLSVAKVVETLAKRGLTLNMTPLEVEEIFGPVGNLPFQLFVYGRFMCRHNGHEQEKCKVILESVSDGKRYESPDGKFMIPIGDYLVVEPKVIERDKRVHVSLAIERRYASSRSHDIAMEN